MNRPKVVTAFACLLFFWAVVGLALVTVFVWKLTFDANAQELALRAAKALYPFNVQFVLIATTVLSVLFFVAGFALWKLRNYGRYLALGLATINILWAVIDIVYQGFRRPTFAQWSGLALSVAMLYYFTRPNIRSIFSDSPKSI